MIVGLDFFGVFIDHMQVKLKAVQRLFPHLDCTTVRDVLRHRLQPRLTAEEYDAITKSLGGRLSFYEPHVGAREASRRIHAAGNRLVIITTTTNFSPQDFYAYAAEKRLILPTLHVVYDDRDKIDRCREEGVSVFADDNQSVLRMLRPLGIPLIWANFSGDDTPADPDFTPVRSWEELEREIMRLAAKQKAMIH